MDKTINGVAITHYNQWTLRLMEREASGENIPYISRDAWREVLGFPTDITAREAIRQT